MDQRTELQRPFYTDSIKQRLSNSLRTGDKTTFIEALKQTSLLMFRDNDGNTLLHLAVQAPKESLFMTNHLLESGNIPVNSCNDRGERPLHLAVGRGDVSLVRLLMAYGANPFVEDHKNQTPFSLANHQPAILSIFTGVTTVDIGLEHLKLRENIRSLTEGDDLITKTLNQLPGWFQRIPLRHHALLLQLQQNLRDRRLMLVDSKMGKAKLKRDSTPSKEKKSSPKLSTALLKHKRTEKLKYGPQAQQMLELLETLKKELADENPNTHKSILSSLDNLCRYYQDIPDPDTLKKEESIKLRLQSPSLGYRNLSEAAAKRFMDSFQKERQQTDYKINSYGLHTVVQMNQTHYKISPTSPGIEYAVHALGQLFTGQASAPTELLILEHASVCEGCIQTQFLPVLASQTIPGTLFLEFLQKQPTTVQQIEPYSFSLQWLLALLTCSVDGKPDNFMAKPQLDAKGQLLHYILVSIDNDEAFSDPIFESGSTKKRHSLMLKTCVFCLPQMDQPVDLVLRKQLLEQEPASLVLKWLKLLQTYNEPFEAGNVASHYLQETLAKVGLPLRLVPETAVKLYQTLCLIQTLLNNQPELTHAQLLEACYPLVAFFYTYVRQQVQNDCLKGVELLYRGPYFEELNLTKEQQEELKKFNQLSNTYRVRRQQSIEQAVEEFCEKLDFAEFAIETQQALLSQMMTDFPTLHHLTLSRFSALGSTVLQEMSRYFVSLEHLVLRDCHTINIQSMHTLLQRFPNLQVTIEGFTTFKPHDLLTLSRFCSRFYLIFPDGSKHWINRENQLLLPMALQQKDVNLTTFLLLAGFHLTQAAQTYSPLHYAIEQKEPLLVEQLIYYGSNINQYIKELSTLDKAYQLLQSTPACEQNTHAKLQTIIVLLLKAGAIETRSPEHILAISIQAWKKQVDNTVLAKSLLNFALVHNQLSAALVNTLISEDTLHIDWSRQWVFGYQLEEEVLTALFSRLKSIKTLNLSGCEGIKKHHLQRSACLGIQTLILDFQQGIDTELLTRTELRVTLQKAGAQVWINAIQLNGTKVVQTRFDLLIRVLSQPQNQIKRLEITNCVLSPMQIQQLAQALSQQIYLKRMILRAVGLGQVMSLEFFLKYLTLPHLVEFCLDDNGLKAEHMEVLSQWLSSHPNLMELSLYRNPLGDAGILALALALHQSRQLTKLNVNEINLTDQGLAEWLQKGVPSSLTFLDIGFNQLTASSISPILEWVRLNQSLGELKFSGQSMLEEAMPSHEFNALLQQNMLADQQRRLLLPYQQHFFQEKLSREEKELANSSTFTLVTSSVLSYVMSKMIASSPVIDRPLLYQRENQQEIDYTLEDNEREQVVLERDIEQLKNSEYQSSIKPLKEQLQILVMQREALQWQRERKVAQQTAIQALNQHPVLCVYYNTVHLKLEELFTHCKTMANQWLKIDSETLPDIDDTFIVNINLLDSALFFVPGLSMIADKTTQLPDALDKQRAGEQVKYIARLGSLKLLLKVAEQTARDLTNNFHSQLKSMYEAPGQSPSFFKDQSLNLNIQQTMQTIAEVAVFWIFVALASQRVQGDTVFSLTRAFIAEVSALPKSDKKLASFAVALPKSIKERLQAVVTTANGEKKRLEDIYQKPEVVTKDVYLPAETPFWGTQVGNGQEKQLVPPSAQGAKQDRF
jgi:ankyrin repeat protein